MHLRLAFLVSLFLVSAGHAGHITIRDDERLAGGTVLTFDETARGNRTELDLGLVTITGVINVSTDYAGSYNTTGTASLQNRMGDGSQFYFSFSSPVTAFGFNWGASDGEWTLNAYNSEAVLVDTFVLPAVRESNAGEFFGIAGDDIKYVTLSHDGYDWVFLDNFTFVAAAIPEPATAALAAGLLGLAGVAWRRRRLA